MRALEFLIERTVLNVADVEAHINTLCQRTEEERIRQWLKRNYRNWLIKDSGGVLRVHGDDGHWRYETGVDYPADKVPAWAGKAAGNGEELVHISNLRKLEDEFGEVIDYLHHMLQGRRGDLSRLSVPQAVEQSEAWHERLANGDGEAVGEDDPQGVRAVLPAGKGWRWVQVIDTAALDREGSLMQHCVGGGSYDAGLQNGTIQIYSLRDPKNEPHITVEVRKGVVHQFKGKQNKPPAEKYRAASVIFLNHLGLPDRDSTSTDLKAMALMGRVDGGRWRYGTMEEVADLAGTFGRLKAYEVPRDDKSEFFLIDRGTLILKAVAANQKLSLHPRSDAIKTTYLADLIGFLNFMALPIDGGTFEEYNFAGRLDDEHWIYGPVREIAEHERELAPGIDLYACRFPPNRHLFVMAGDRRLAFLTVGNAFGFKVRPILSRFRDEAANEAEQRVVIGLLNDLGLPMSEDVNQKIPYRAVKDRENGDRAKWGMVREVGTLVEGLPDGVEAYRIHGHDRPGVSSGRHYHDEYTVFRTGTMAATVVVSTQGIAEITMAGGYGDAVKRDDLMAVVALLNVVKKPILSGDLSSWLHTRGIYWVEYNGRQTHLPPNTYGTLDQVGQLVKDFGDGKRAYVLPTRRRDDLFIMDGDRQLQIISGGTRMEMTDYGLTTAALPYVVALVREGLCRVDTFGNMDNKPNSVAGALKKAGYHLAGAWQWQYDEDRDNIENPTHFHVLYHDDDLALPVRLTVRNATLRKNLSVEKMTLGEAFERIIEKPFTLPDGSGVIDESFSRYEQEAFAANIFGQGACVYDLKGPVIGDLNGQVARIRFKIERLDGKTSGYTGG
jgi:hypothetical protein